MKFIPYILKCLWRHRTRTSLTVTGAAVALFVFAFVGAVQQGLARLTQDRAAQRTLIVFQANRFCPSTSRLPEDYQKRIAAVPGVAEVVPIQVFMNNCRASLDLVVFHGLPVDKLREFRDIDLIAGEWSSFAKRTDAALAGQALAKRRNLKVGDRFTIGEATVTIEGIFRSPQPANDHFLLTHLPYLQQTPGLNAIGTVTQFEVRLADDADVQNTAKAIDDLFRAGPIMTDTRPKSIFQANAVGDLVELIRLTTYLGYACLGLVFALVATTTVMAVQDRIKEHAVLQTLGFTTARVFSLVMVESVLVSLAGGLAGIGSAMIFLLAGNFAIGTEGVVIALRPTLDTGLIGILVALAVGVAAGIAPAWQASRADIVSSLRAV